MDKINIENAEKISCPDCGTIIGMGNGTNFIYKNIAWIYFKKVDKSDVVLKCRKCKKVIEIK